MPMPMPMSMSMSMSKMSSPNNLGHQNCWSQAPESRDGRWIKAQKLCDSFYPSRSAFEAVPLTRNRSDGITVPAVFSEREALIARIVLNSNRDEGQEYVEKLKDNEFAYHSRKEVRWGLFARQCVCILRSCFLLRLVLRCSLFMKYISFFLLCTQLLEILDALTASHFKCYNISTALNTFADKELPGSTTDGLPARNVDATCTVRTDLAAGFRYENLKTQYMCFNGFNGCNGLTVCLTDCNER
jgi:hypothetical protein